MELTKTGTFVLPDGPQVASAYRPCIRVLLVLLLVVVLVLVLLLLLSSLSLSLSD